MLKKVFLLGLIISFTNLFSQHTVKGKLTPVGKHSWVILYKLNGVNQKYVDYANLDNKKFTKEGAFTVQIPKDSPAGMYRLLYDNKNNKFIDFIYNNEDVTLEFHPDYPAQLVKYAQSDENKLYQNYIEKIASLQNKLDSIQVVYFQTKDKKQEATLSDLYSKNLTVLHNTQSTFEENSKGKLAYNFIKANKRFYADHLIKDTKEYLNTIKKHYFDNVDFNNKTLTKSSILIDRIMDYVFYLNTAKNTETLIKLRKEGVDTALSKIDNASFKKDAIESLLYTFAQKEDLKMVAYLFKNHFDKLPVGLQDFDFKKMIQDMLKTTIGNKAPNIVWKDLKGKEHNLYKLKGKKYYLVVFWSSTCPHCTKEMPILNDYIKDKTDVQVIAVGLETKASKIDWVDVKYDYDTFMHVLALSSSDESVFKSKYVEDYGVDGTPNFYLLDSDKNIIAKPYDVKELKEVYAKLKKSEKKESKEKKQ